MIRTYFIDYRDYLIFPPDDTYSCQNYEVKWNFYRPDQNCGTYCVHYFVDVYDITVIVKVFMMYLDVIKYELHIIEQPEYCYGSGSQK